MSLRKPYTRLGLLLLSLSAKATALSANGKRPATRVAIVGGGIAGLSVAHAITNSPLLEQQYGAFDYEVSIFEARRNLDTKAGAGVQLNGGLAALGKINGKVQRAVLDAGLSVSQIQSRSKPWSTSKPYETLLQLNLFDIVQRAGGNVSQNLIQEGQLLWTAIMRGCLQDTLWKTLPSTTRRSIKFNKALVGITPRPDGSVMCEFSDKTTAGPFDVVVGADGINSACKEYIETGKISTDPANRGGKSAIYSGIRIKYAVDDEWKPKDGEVQSATLKQYFGDGANVLDGTYGNGANRPNSKIAFFVFLDKESGPFRKKETAEEEAETPDENVDWREGAKKNDEVARKTMTKEVQNYGVPSMDVVPIIKAADRFFELGVYFHNPFSLAGWSKKLAGKNGAVVALCGDAAHTIPPFLGQASNQAIQDAYCFVSKLYEYNANVVRGEDGANLKQLLKDYERTRWFHTFTILLNTCFLGYLETGGDNGFYAKFRDLFFRTTGLLGIAQLVLLSAAVPKV